MEKNNQYKIKTNEIKVYALGGQDELGKSLYILEVGNKLIAFDAGVKDVDSFQLNNEILVADITYLQQNASRLIGFFISNSDKDSMGALVYFANKLKVPIYCSPYTKHSILNLFKRYKAKLECEIKVLENNQELDFERFKIKVLFTLHSSFETLVFVVKTEFGNIWFARCFLIGTDDKSADFMSSVMREATTQKTLLAMLDSRFAEQEGFTHPKQNISNIIQNWFLEFPKSRILISCFDQNIYNAQEIIKIANRQKRNVYIYGKTLNDNLLEAARLKNFTGDFVLGSFEEMDNSDNGIIIIGGNEDRLFKKITRLGLNSDDNLHLKSSDVFINNAFADIVNELKGINAINELAKSNVEIRSIPKKEIRQIGPSSADTQLFLSMIEPKYFLPICGLYKNFIAQLGNASRAHISKERVIIMDNGEIVLFTDGELQETRTKIHSDSVFVNNNNVDDVDVKLMASRVALGNFGIAFVGFGIDNEWNIQTGIDIQMRGVVYLRNNQGIIENISEIVQKSLEQEKGNKNPSIDNLQKELENTIAKHIQKYHNKTPKVSIFIQQM